MLNFLDEVLSGGLRVTSNRKASAGSDKLTIHTTPAQGGFQISEVGLQALRVGKGGYVVLANLTEGISSRLPESFKPAATNAAGKPLFYIAYRGLSEDVDGKPVTIGSKVALVGNNGQISSSLSWEELGGNEDSKSIYDMGEAIFGFAFVDGVAYPITADTDNDLVAEAIVVLSETTDANKQLATVATVATAKACKPLFMLSFVETRDKLQRGEGEGEDETPATEKPGKKAKATTAAADLEGFDA